MRNLREVDLEGKRVLYHPDYSVPLEDGVIKDDYRIISTFDTLDYLIEQGAKVIICTKIGDPKGKVVPELDTRPVAERLADEYTDRVVRLAHAIDAPEVEQAIEEMEPGDILMLPNVRFYPEEQDGDLDFAKKLAGLADLYVNDAFSVDHRSDASIVGVPQFLPSYPGFLLEKELEHLGSLLKKPAHPFVVIMGGAKVSDKIEVIKSLAKIADHILVGGAMANTFLLAKGEEISESKAENDKVDLAKQLIDELGEKLVLASDYVKDSKEGPFKYLDIGPQAVEDFMSYLKEAKTIFWNGSLGYAEDPRYAVATEEIAKYIGNLKGVSSIVAGGDTVQTITDLKLHDKFTFISTGGGAALELLAGEKLPGIVVLEESKEGGVKEKVEEQEEKAEKSEDLKEKPEEKTEAKVEEKEETAEEPMEAHEEETEAKELESSEAEEVEEEEEKDEKK